MNQRLKEMPAVVIVGGGLMQLEAVLAANRLGYASIVTDRNPQAPCAILADHFAAIDIHDAQAHIDLVADLLGQGVNVRGILAEGIDAEMTCAHVAAHFGFAWMSPHAALACANKGAMRLRFEASHDPALTNVSFMVGESESGNDLFWLTRMRLPFVLKPTSLSASRGVTIVTSAEQIPDAIARLHREAGPDASWIAEEYLEGPQQSVEILFPWDGAPPIRLNIVDRVFQPGSSVIEIGHVNPTQLPERVQAEIYDLAERAARAIGVRVGAFKCDTILTDEGPKILEVAGRLSGGFDAQLTTPLATGRDVIGAAILVACRDDRLKTSAFDDLLTHRWRRVAVCEGVFVDSEIVVGPLGRDPGIWVTDNAARVFRFGPGARIVPAEHCAQRAGFGIGVASTFFEADLLAAEVAGDVATYYRQWATDGVRVVAE